MIVPSLLGLVLALALYAVSVSPSLLPRSWWWHAAVSGVLVTVGYLIGLILERLWVPLTRWTGLTISAFPAAQQWFRWGAVILFLLWFLRTVVRSTRHSRQAAALVAMPAESWGASLLGVIGTLVVAYLLLGLIGGLVWIARRIVALVSLWTPRPVAWLIAAAILALLLVVLTSRVLIRGAVGFFSRQARKMNISTARGIFRPMQPERSGSPASLSRWESVGGQGRVFLGRGPHRWDIEAVTGRPAMEPIRVYAGMPRSRAGLEVSARLVVEELRRTRAFDRAVLVVTASTGSGWVDEWEAQPVEYLTGGNCAVASMQYSYLPSAINFLTGLDISVEAARVLFHEVRTAIDELPEGHPRPALFVTGESLGAYASQQVFKDLDDVLAHVSGALWVGTPSFTPMHWALTQARHRGSPEVAPVYDNARAVRFVNVPEDLRADVYGRELGPWLHPRVVYAQHPSDPVVWWRPGMAWNQPDWLREKAGRDVSRSMEYTRLATLIQVLADLPVAGTAPGGHGHSYHEELIPLWEDLLGLHDVDREVEGMASLDLAEGSWVDDDMRQRIGQAISANIALSDRE